MKIVCGWGDAMADGGRVHRGAGDVYTMAGGLKMVAITDSLQSIVMILATVVSFHVAKRSEAGAACRPSSLPSPPSLSNR